VEGRGRGEIHAVPPRDRRVVFVAAQMKRAASSVFDDGEIVRGVASRRLIRSPSAWDAVAVERLRRPGFDGRGLGRGAGRVAGGKPEPSNQPGEKRGEQRPTRDRHSCHRVEARVSSGKSQRPEDIFRVRSLSLALRLAFWWLLLVVAQQAQRIFLIGAAARRDPPSPAVLGLTLITGLRADLVTASFGMLAALVLALLVAAPLALRAPSSARAVLGRTLGVAGA